MDKETNRRFEERIGSMDKYQLKVARKFLRHRKRTQEEDKLLELVLKRYQLLLEKEDVGM